MKEHQAKAALALAIAAREADPHSPAHLIAEGVYKLQKIAVALHKRYENACSYEWACTEKHERATEKLEEKAQAIGRALNITIGHQRDPRGWPLHYVAGGREGSLC